MTAGTLKTDNQESSEIKCYLDRVFKPMIKNDFWIETTNCLKNLEISKGIAKK